MFIELVFEILTEGEAVRLETFQLFKLTVLVVFDTGEVIGIATFLSLELVIG